MPFFDKRNNFITSLDNAFSGVQTLGFSATTLTPGSAELAVLLPRALFHNELGDFKKDLRVLNNIIRTFYELANVTPEPIELKEISTSDPLMFLGVDVTVLVLLSAAVK